MIYVIERVPGTAINYAELLPTFQSELSENTDFFFLIKIHGTSEFYPWSPWGSHWPQVKNLGFGKRGAH